MIHKDARSLPIPLQEKIRHRCVEAVLSGSTQSQVAKKFGVSRCSVNKWVKLQKTGVKELLKAKEKGRPKGKTLKNWQIAQTTKAIYNYYPNQLGLPFFLWTREAIVQFIYKKFSLSLSKWTVGRYLKIWGLTPQKPIRRAIEQNKKDIEIWLSTEYPKIKKLAKHERGTIFWGDEMGLRSDDNRGRSYGKIGKTPIVNRTGQRFGRNMISAITNYGQLYFMIFKEKFVIPVFLKFIKKMLAQVDRKIFLIIDRHPVHKSQAVQKWLKSKIDKIEIFFLPGYCPELNPDELLNQDVKANVMKKYRPQNQQELISQVRIYLHMRQKQPAIIQNMFKARLVQYAAL